MKTPVTKEKISQHVTYNWWKYALLFILAYFAVDLLYTTTAYRSPPEKVVDFYIYGYADNTALDAYMEQVRQEYLPDMEEMRSQTLLTDDSYGAQILFTYMATGEGDLYLLPRDEFITNAGNGALLPLEGDAELMAIFDEAGISLQSGWRRYTDTGETHLYGIPLSKLPGLERYAYAKDGFVSVLVTGGNDENTLKFLKILCRDMLTAEETPTEETEGSEATETAAPEAAATEVTDTAP